MEKHFAACYDSRSSATGALSAQGPALYQKEPDADQILAVAEQAKTHLTSSVGSAPTYQEQFAVGYLLKGDYEKAMQAMEAYMSFTTSYGTPAYSVSSCNLYALCSLLSGDQEGWTSSICRKPSVFAAT